MILIMTGYIYLFIHLLWISTVFCNFLIKVLHFVRLYSRILDFTLLLWKDYLFMLLLFFYLYWIFTSPFSPLIPISHQQSPHCYPCGTSWDPFEAWEMWPSPHSEKPVRSKVGGQDPRPWTGFPVGNQACIVHRLLWDLLLLKLPHPELRQQMFTEYL